MERESIFLVILVFLLISLTIYEAFSDHRGTMVLGRGKWNGAYQPAKNDWVSDDEKDMTNQPSTTCLNGTLLPPILEYKRALSHSIISHLNAVLRVTKNSSKSSLLAAIKGFNKYFDKAYSRFMFTANSKGALNSCMVPTEDPIDYDDLSYYLRSHSCSVIINKIRNVPDSLSFKQMGKDVTGAKYENGMISNPGTGSFPLDAPQYARLREIYTGPEDRFDSMAYTLVYIYHSLGGLGNNGSVPIGLLNDDDGNDLGVIELFGSPLNTQSRKGYCSPFTVEKEYFGSLGSFYDYELLPGQLYTCNPPYIDGMMEEAAVRVVDNLKRLQNMSTETSTDVFFVFPVWDKEGLQLIGDPKKDDDPNADARYGCLEVLRNSGLVRAEKILHKDAHKYYSWYGDKLVAYSHTYIFVLSTADESRINLDEYLARWDMLVAKKEQTGTFGSRLEQVR